MIRAFRSEWILLNRKKLWLVLGAITAVYTAVATTLVISTAEPLLQQSEGGLALETLVGAGGATMAVIFSIAFAFILVVATFASSTGNEFARGTLRSALTFHSNRVSLIAGKVAARVLVAAIVMAGALVIGSITAAIVAPAQDISTTGWFGLAALGEGVEDYLRSIVYVVGFAVIGTTIAVLLRSTPVALGVGLLWFGPIENVIGEGQAWAERWFPGMVLRSIVQPQAADSIATPTALATLGAYRRRLRRGDRGGDVEARRHHRLISTPPSPRLSAPGGGAPVPGTRWRTLSGNRGDPPWQLNFDRPVQAAELPIRLDQFLHVLGKAGLEIDDLGPGWRDANEHHLLVETACSGFPFRHALISNKSSGALDEFVRYAIDGLECRLAPYQEDVRRKVFSVDRQRHLRIGGEGFHLRGVGGRSHDEDVAVPDVADGDDAW